MFYAPIQTIVDEEEELIDEPEKLSPEYFVEIGKYKEFENTKFYEISRLEAMISKYDYKLRELIKEGLAIYLIHNELDFINKYPNLWHEIQNQFNDVQIFVFLSISQSPQLLPLINTEKLFEESYDFRILLWKSWGVETLTLESLYQVLRYNILL